MLKEPDIQSELFEKTKLHATVYGYQENDPSNVSDFRVLSDYELIYNVGGTTIVQMCDERYEVRQGELILIPSLTYHKIDTPKDDVHKNYWVHFTLEPSLLSKHMIDALIVNWGGLTKKIGLDETLLYLYETMHEEDKKAGNFHHYLCQSYFMQIWLYLLQDAQVRLDASVATNDTLHERVLHYVYEHYCDIHSVQEIATANNISLTYCNMIFKKHLGMSPAKYILYLKLKKGEYLLQHTDLSIQKISEMLNFSSQYHFSNVFKERYQMSPLKYKKMKGYWL